MRFPSIQPQGRTGNRLLVTALTPLIFTGAWPSGATTHHSGSSLIVASGGEEEVTTVGRPDGPRDRHEVGQQSRRLASS